MLYSVADIARLSRLDRLSLSLCGSLVAHAVLVLGVSFVMPRLIPGPDAIASLDVVLVHSPDETNPDQAEFLAAYSRDGPDRDHAAPAPPRPATAGQPDAPAPTHQSARSVNAGAPAALLNIRGAGRAPEPRAGDARDSLTSAAEPLRAVLGADAFSQNGESAALSELAARYPRQKYLNAATRESRFANYMDLWKARVEDVGNRYYPPHLRERGLHGDLVLDVSLFPDGRVAHIAVLRSSGNVELDQAAADIVHMAEPFDPFPAEFREDIDVLHITRTWVFTGGGHIVTRR